MTIAATKPAQTEFAPYYSKYVLLVTDGDIVGTLNRQAQETLSLLRSLPEEKGNFRYAPDKWSVKELIGHMIDAERIFSYRALRFARNDQTALSGFEQDDYVRAGNFDRRALSDLVQEFEDVRRATISLFSAFDEEAWLRRGVANENEISVRALAFITAGHELHHVGILRERYLSA